MEEPLVKWFRASTYQATPTRPELPGQVSRAFEKLATALVDALPASAERSVALRKLLESREAALRASLGAPPLIGAADEGEAQP